MNIVNARLSEVGYYLSKVEMPRNFTVYYGKKLLNGAMTLQWGRTVSSINGGGENAQPCAK